MLEDGTLISFDDPETGETLTGVVQSCNRRGTVCTVELSNEEVQRINLSIVKHAVLGRPETDVANSDGNARPQSNSEDEGTDSEDEDAVSENEDADDNNENADNIDEEPVNARSEGVDELPGEDEGAINGIEDLSDADIDSDESIDDDPETKLDAFDATLGRAIEELTSALEDSDQLQQNPRHLEELSKNTLQALYAMAKQTSDIASDCGLPELYVEGFDSEQIWGQLEASVQPALKKSRKQIKKLQMCERLLTEDTEAALDELLEQYHSGEDDQDSEPESDEAAEDGPQGSDGPMQDRNALQQSKKRKRPDKSVHSGHETSRVRLPTEDEFFSLGDMERFVQDAEQTAAERPEAEDEDKLNDGDSADESDDEDAAEDSDIEGLNMDAIHGLDSADDESEDESASDEDDAELARMLEGYSGNGRISGSKRKKAPSIDEEDQDQIFYKDFFGSGPAYRPNLDADRPSQDSPGQRKKAARGEDFTLAADEAEQEEDDEDSLDELEPMEEGDGELEDPDNLLNGVAQEEDDDSDGQERLLSTLRTLIDRKKAEEAEDSKKLTAHDRRQRQIAERARKLEDENMGEKDWHMRGETRGDKRPLNSALEVDLDFERALKPPPQPTEEFTSTLEDLIKQRIADMQFDDPIRRAPPSEEVTKEIAEIDDKKASKGLGEEYADDFIKSKTGNAVEDKDEATRSQCRLLLKSLFAKLDALSHFHFAPKPIIKEMSVQKEVPALAMEEIAPQVMSEAARQLPEEVFQVDPKASRKQDREQGEKNRNTQRTSMKRAMKKRKANEAEKRLLRGDSGDGVTNIIGRKSAKQNDLALEAAKKERRKQKRARTRPDDGPKIKYNKSSTVFGKLQDAKDGLGAKLSEPATSSKALKL